MVRKSTSAWMVRKATECVILAHMFSKLPSQPSSLTHILPISLYCWVYFSGHTPSSPAPHYTAIITAFSH